MENENRRGVTRMKRKNGGVKGINPQKVNPPEHVQKGQGPGKRDQVHLQPINHFLSQRQQTGIGKKKEREG